MLKSNGAMHGAAAYVTDHYQMPFLDYRLVKLRRRLYANRHSTPFISADAYASIAQYHPYGRRGDEVIDRQLLAEAESLFVNSDRFDQLLSEYGASISARVLITGNGDRNWEAMPELPNSVSLWLVQNSSVTNPRVKTLPIGLENLSLGQRGLPGFFTPYRGPRASQVVLVPPMSNTNRNRLHIVRNALTRPDMFEVMTSYLGTARYFKIVRRFLFVLCLEGNGADTHRVWETLYFGNFPVVLSTPWSRSLEYLGLPLLLVETLADVTSELLADFARRHRAFDPATAEPLWIPYWKAIIDSHLTRPIS